jgi:hypothetical protein
MKFCEDWVHYWRYNYLITLCVQNKSKNKNRMYARLFYNY